MTLNLKLIIELKHMFGSIYICFDINLVIWKIQVTKNYVFLTSKFGYIFYNFFILIKIILFIPYKMNVDYK